MPRGLNIGLVAYKLSLRPKTPKQGRGAGTQISSPDSSSGRLTFWLQIRLQLRTSNFLAPDSAPAPTSSSFYLRLQDDLVQ